jgi:hypothetical protein
MGRTGMLSIAGNQAMLGKPATAGMEQQQHKLCTNFLLHCYKHEFKYQDRVSSAGHESQPIKNITDAVAAV